MWIEIDANVGAGSARRRGIKEGGERDVKRKRINVQLLGIKLH